ncbi:unnamed protein product [Caretta caretta]
MVGDGWKGQPGAMEELRVPSTHLAMAKQRGSEKSAGARTTFWDETPGCRKGESQEMILGELGNITSSLTKPHKTL